MGIVYAPSGWVAPANAPAAVTVSNNTTLYTALNNLQIDAFSILNNTNYIYALSDTIYNNTYASYLTGNSTNAKVFESSTKIDALTAKFSNYSGKLQAIKVQDASILSRLDNMQPQVITQSISFLLGAFVALAFVMASKFR